MSHLRIIGGSIGKGFRTRRVREKNREAWNREWHRRGFRRLVTTVRIKGGRCRRGARSFTADISGNGSVGIEVTR